MREQKLSDEEMSMNWFRRTLLPVGAALITAAVISAVWYSPLAFGKRWIALRSEVLHVAPDPYIAPWKPIIEFLREIVVAYVLLHFVRHLKITRVANALSFGFWAWLGFPVSMLVGASLWDNKPWALSLIHGGDWLAKLLAMTTVVALTHRPALPHRTADIPQIATAD